MAVRDRDRARGVVADSGASSARTARPACRAAPRRASSSSSGPSRVTRRSTALIRPGYFAARRSACTSRTLRSTAAWSGTSRNRICAAPISSTVSTRGASLGKPESRNWPQQMAQRADPAQHGRDQLAHQRAVAIGKRREARMRLRAVELAVERPVAAQHVVEDVGGNASCGETGDLRWRYPSCRCHGHPLAADRRRPATAPNHFRHCNEADARAVQPQFAPATSAPRTAARAAAPRTARRTVSRSRRPGWAARP